MNDHEYNGGWRADGECRAMGADVHSGLDPEAARTMVADLYTAKAAQWIAALESRLGREAEDVVHDAFAILWRIVTGRGVPRNVHGLMVITIQRLTLNRWRHCRVVGRAAEGVEAQIRAMDRPWMDPLRVTTDAELDSAIQALVDALPLHQKVSWERVRRDGQPVSEAAAALGVKHGSLRKTLSRANESLRKGLEAAGHLGKEESK